MKKTIVLTLLLVLLKTVNAQTNHWTPMTGNQYNMTVYGVIVIDGIQQAVTTLEVGAFCGEECRASEFPLEYEPGVYVVPMTIRSNATGGETITFKLYDHTINQELNLECVNTVTFEADGIIIDPDNWFQFSFVTPAFHFTTAGNWSVASNWQGGALPGTTDIVFIDANCTMDQNVEVTDLTVSNGFALILQTGRTLTVSGTLTNTVATGLVIEDGAQVINESANVAATAEKDITAFGVGNPDGWYTIASPMSNMTILGSDFLTPEYDLYRYNETSIGEEWENYKDSNNTDFTTFETGRGYLYANDHTFSPAFVGTLNYADASYQVTYTNRTDGLDGFNLIGNPFPHVIYKGAGGAIDDAHLASGYYTLTNEGAWNVHIYNEAIQPGQGILVKATQTATVDIAKTNAVATAEASSKGTEGSLVIEVNGLGCSDKSYVFFTRGCGLNKMPNLNESLPSLFVRNEGGDYAIAHVGADCESLELMFHNSQPGHFTIDAKTEGVRFSYLHLIDRVTGANVDLLLNPSYGFEATGQEYDARFALVFKVMTGVDETMESTPFAYLSDGAIVVDGTGELQVIDMTGRIVVCKEVSGSLSVTDIPTGVYVLRLTEENQVKNQKIVIQ